jgi:CheY-like chemotaxis protein
MNTLAPKCALVIDDEPLVSILLEDILRDQGYEVTVVNTHEALEEALSGKWYEVAITDTDLAIFAAMSKWSVDRIIICSGKSANELQQHYPGVPIIQKPIDEALLTQLLSKPTRS